MKRGFFRFRSQLTVGVVLGVRTLDREVHALLRDPQVVRVLECAPHTSNCPVIGREYFCWCECSDTPVLTCTRRTLRSRSHSTSPPCVSTRQLSSTLLVSSSPKQLTSWFPESGLWMRCECNHFLVFTCCSRDGGAARQRLASHAGPAQRGFDGPVRVPIVHLAEARDRLLAAPAAVRDLVAVQLRLGVRVCQLHRAAAGHLGGCLARPQRRRRTRRTPRTKRDRASTSHVEGFSDLEESLCATMRAHLRARLCAFASLPRGLDQQRSRKVVERFFPDFGVRCNGRPVSTDQLLQTE